MNDHTPDIPVVVVGFNRPDALRRLLRSIEAASYAQPVKLYISLDGGGGEEVASIARGFDWNHGEKEVIMHDANLGLREHVLRCGDLSLKHDALIVLEDDLVVSSCYYDFALQAFNFYQKDERVAGISLYAHLYNETSQFPIIPLEDGSDVFFMQYASSWGQVWEKDDWASFRAWYANNKDNSLKNDPAIPPNVQYWPESSWKKFFIRYLIEKDKYFVFPRVSYTTMFNEGGTHQKLREHFLQVPLQMGRRTLNFVPFAESGSIYDVYGELNAELLRKMVPSLNGYDLEVDLNGMKPASKMGKEFLLTTRSVKIPILSFGREMKPPEMNLIHQVPGNDIHLARIQDCSDVPYLRKLLKVHEKQELAYRYPIREYHFGQKSLLTTKAGTDRNIGVGFFFKKVIVTVKYAWNYFFGRSRN